MAIHFVLPFFPGCVEAVNHPKLPGRVDRTVRSFRHLGWIGVRRASRLSKSSRSRVRALFPLFFPFTTCASQASKRVDRTSRYFRRLGVIGFWGQLVCSLVAAVILAFSIIITGTPSAPVSTYLTFVGILAAFTSVFWSFGYLRMADRLKFAVDNPMKVHPPTYPYQHHCVIVHTHVFCTLLHIIVRVLYSWLCVTVAGPWGCQSTAP